MTLSKAYSSSEARENILVFSNSSSTLIGSPISLPFAGSTVTIHQAGIGAFDRCVLTINYPKAATAAAVLTLTVSTVEAVTIEMQPGSVFTYDAMIGATLGQPNLRIQAKIVGGDADAKVTGYVIRKR